MMGKGALFSSRVREVGVEETLSMVLYQDLSPHKPADLLLLPETQAEEDEDQHEEDRQSEQSTNTEPWRGGDCGLTITANHSSTLLQISSLHTLLH